MFSASAPVSGPAFYNRVVELEQLLRVADGPGRTPRWLALVGVRKVGKTSLLLEAAHRLATARTDIRFVAIDVFESMPISPGFFRRYALRVADRLLAGRLGLSLEMLAADNRAYAQALAGSSGFAALPGDLRGELLVLPTRAPDDDFIRWAIDLPERLARATKQRVVIAIDEFQELAALGGKHGGRDPLPLLRSLWQQHQATSYVISGSARSMLTNLVTSRHSPFFQHFELLNLGPFSEKDSLALLDRWAPRGRHIPMSLGKEIVRITAGHPFYLQVVGDALVQYEPPYDTATLKDVLQATVFSRTGRIGLYFQAEFDRLVGRSSQLAAMLSALAPGPGRLSDLAHAMRAPSGAAVKAIERLGDAVEKGPDGRYLLSDPTFALWLTWRGPGGAAVPMKLLGDEGEQRVADELAAFGFDLVYQSRASRGAFDLLATRGSSQLGVQVKASSMPLRFSRAAWTRMQAEAARFGWRWVVAGVPPGGSVAMLDPGLAKLGKQVTLDSGAGIANLLTWLDAPEPRSPRSKARPDPRPGAARRERSAP